MGISYPASTRAHAAGTTSIAMTVPSGAKRGDVMLTYATVLQAATPPELAASTRLTLFGSGSHLPPEAGHHFYYYGHYRVLTDDDAGSTYTWNHTTGQAGTTMETALVIARGVKVTAGNPLVDNVVEDQQNTDPITVDYGTALSSGLQHGVWLYHIHSGEPSTEAGWSAGTKITGTNDRASVWYTTTTGAATWASSTIIDVTGADYNWIAARLDPSTQTGFRFLVDWDNDGVFSTATTSIRTLVPVNTDRGMDADQPLYPVMAGYADLALVNSPTTTYHPAINTDVKPGRDIAFEYLTTSTDGAVGIFRGNLDDIDVGDPAEPFIDLTVLDGLGRMFIKDISTALSTNITTGTAIGLVLDAVGWSSTRRSLDTGGTTIAYWWEEGTPAIEALQKLVDSEGPGARLFVNKDGAVEFHDRHRRFTNTKESTSQVTFTNDSEPKYSIPLPYLPKWRDILNDITFVVNDYTLQATSVVWTYPFDTITLGASEVRKIIATGIVAFQSAVAPVEDTDFTIDAGAVASATLDRTSGQAVTITLTAGAGGATISGLQLRADAISQSDTVEVNAQSTDSQNSYGKRSFRRFAPWMPESVARDVAQELVNIQSEPNPIVRTLIANATTGRTDQQIRREIGDRITVTDTVSGLSTAFTIERIQHAIADAGKTFDTVFTARRVSTAALSSTDVFILNSASNGILNENKLGF